MLDALQSSMKAQVYCEKAERERIERVYTTSGTNILKISTLAFITAMVSTEVEIVRDLVQHKPYTLPLPNLMLTNRNSHKMNENIRNASRRDKEYDVSKLPNEEQDPLWYQILPQYP